MTPILIDILQGRYKDSASKLQQAFILIVDSSEKPKPEPYRVTSTEDPSCRLLLGNINVLTHDPYTTFLDIAAPQLAKTTRRNTYTISI